MNKIDFINEVLKMLGASAQLDESSYLDVADKDIDSFVDMDSMKIMRLVSFIHEKIGIRIGGNAGDIEAISSLKGLSEMYERHSNIL